MFRSPLGFCSLTVLALALTACTPTVMHRGTMIDPEKLEEIKTGESTREDVMTRLGSPTQIGTFEENTWYYFGQTTERTAFFDPEVIAQTAIEVRFNDEGTVSEIKKLDPSEAQKIDPVSRRTPTYGRETTILEQLVGNLGRAGAMNKKVGEK